MNIDPYRQLQEKKLKKIREEVGAVVGTLGELFKAALTLKESHGLVLFQIWNYRYAENGNDKWISRVIAHRTDDFHDYLKNCYHIQAGSCKLALKALETYQTYFTTNIKKGKFKDFIPGTESYCCLAMCLKNVNCIGHVDFPFEMMFKLDDKIHPYVFLDSLFIKLESCLPTFKLSSGAKFGHQSLVLDVDTLKALELSKPEEDQLSSLNALELEKPERDQLSSFKSEDGLKHATVEIQEALSILTKSHGLTICQVWTHHSNEGPECAMKLDNGYCDDAFKGYYDSCIKIHDGMAGLVLNTLLTRETHVAGCVMNSGDLAIAICLRNIYTEDLDYVFEFFFSSIDNNKNNNSCEFLKSFLLTLQSCLPSFKLSSGEEFGHQSLVLDADTFKALEKVEEDQLSSLKINFEGGLKRAVGEIQRDCKEDIKQQKCGTSNSTTLNNNTNDRGDVGVMDVRISVSASVNFADLKTIISQNFHLNDYRLTYSFQGLTRPLWIELESDQDLQMCISLCISKKITQLPIRIVQYTSNEGFLTRSRHAKSRHAILNIS
ncbi:uncharacterized protein [Rutidosis leptorrhynchoides]|uniref:uncharacterized protein n=1 Tax=Rutidosis leptorrhynchoides TaxID=125765 RepID=UPI003A9A1147